MIKIKKILSKRKTICLQINSDLEILLKVPYNISEKECNNFIEKNREWIYKKLEVLKEKKKKWKKIDFKEGEKIPYLGNFYVFKFISDSKKSIYLNKELLTIYINSKLYPKIKYYFIKFSKMKLKEIVENYVLEYSKKFSVKFNSIKITSSKTRWGSCTSNGNLNFSFRLIFVPDFVIRYIVVHELVHLKIKNHKRKFWDEVGKLFPQYKDSKKWLKENSFIIEII
ncbi:MAG: M48 family metallopeptidase [Spirochaetes bacterium]|nr:M48 family metallopeptidase [Spirochaetota bacterium]